MSLRERESYKRAPVLVQLLIESMKPFVDISCLGDNPGQWLIVGNEPNNAYVTTYLWYWSNCTRAGDQVDFQGSITTGAVITTTPAGAIARIGEFHNDGQDMSTVLYMDGVPAIVRGLGGLFYLFNRLAPGTEFYVRPDKQATTVNLHVIAQIGGQEHLVCTAVLDLRTEMIVAVTPAA